MSSTIPGVWPDDAPITLDEMQACAATLKKLYATDRRFDLFDSSSCRELRKSIGPDARMMVSVTPSLLSAVDVGHGFVTKQVPTKVVECYSDVDTSDSDVHIDDNETARVVAAQQVVFLLTTLQQGIDIKKGQCHGRNLFCSKTRLYNRNKYALKSSSRLSFSVRWHDS